jgi:hypothetical protein
MIIKKLYVFIFLLYTAHIILQQDSLSFDFFLGARVSTGLSLFFT